MKEFRIDQLSQAANILRNGGLIAFPTETVFGLGVIYDNKESYDRLIDVKRRPPEKPFTLMCSSSSDIEKYAYLNDKAKKLIAAFVPGEFTIILKAKENLPSWCVSKEGMVGIRVPNDINIQKLISLVKKPLLVPSANKSGEPPLTKDKDVLNTFSNEIDGIILGESKSNVPSTIVIVNDDDVSIVRLGKISKEDIEKTLKE
ncbi:MAG: threonylcarbamoyl-AMP synthase [Bacilli bacterium]|nr:threonylcarbamoyl-AMP synthase [Bacilli bacterium]